MTPEDFKLVLSYSKICQIQRIIMEADNHIMNNQHQSPIPIKAQAYDYIKNIAFGDEEGIANMNFAKIN